jgi:medium-chain acyl-[acyl-carrier-protein] hydrolase
MEQTQWFTRFNRLEDAPYRLICFPSVGGGANLFRTWPEALQGAEVWAATLPGRGRRIGEPARDCVEQLVDEITPELARLTDKRYLLFGHSLGALLVFEIAMRLRELGFPSPRHLFVSAFRSPERSNPNREMHRLPDVEFIQELRRYGGTPDVVLEQREMMQVLLPTLRADFKLYETWRYRECSPLDCPITALAGLNDSVARVGEMESWGRWTRQDFELRLLRGGHFFIQDSRANVMRLLQHRINRYFEAEFSMFPASAYAIRNLAWESRASARATS